jgi:hypothetical protein
MPSVQAQGLARPFTCVLLVALLAIAPNSALNADDTSDVRAQAGARMFRALLNVDLDIEKKTVDKNQLLIVFVYTDDKTHAADLAARFVSDARDSGAIHGMPVVTELSSDGSLAAYKARVPAGIFLAQAPNANALHSLIRYGIEHHVIVYSPFEGHVEQGVLGGLAVEAQVRPYVNLTTLAASNINLKQLIFKVTKVTR